MTLTHELAGLQEDLRRWRADAAGTVLRFEPSEALFLHNHWTVRASSLQRHADRVLSLGKWMHTLRLAEELLAPILANDVAQAAHVRQAAARITANVVVGESGDFPPSSRAIIVPEVAMQRYLLDAVAFAQRWLALHGPAVAVAPAALPDPGAPLVDELCSRRDAVLAELHALAADAATRELQTAASCMMLAVEQVHELLTGELAIGSQEPPLQALLSGELLRFPQVRLDADWLPMCAPAEFIEQLLDYLVAPRPSWAMAYRLQAQQGDDRATERLLMLPVWSPAQRDQLARQRSERVEASRRELQAELDAVENTLQSAVRRGRLKPLEAAGFEAGVQALRRKIDRGTDWTVQRSEVRDVWRRLAERGVARDTVGASAVPLVERPPRRPADGTVGADPLSVLYDSADNR